MRKRLISPIPHGVSHPDDEWLDLGKAAMVEVTSGVDPPSAFV